MTLCGPPPLECHVLLNGPLLEMVWDLECSGFDVRSRPVDRSSRQASPSRLSPVPCKPDLMPMDYRKKGWPFDTSISPGNTFNIGPLKPCNEGKKRNNLLFFIHKTSWLVFLNRWATTHFWVVRTHFRLPKLCNILFCWSPTTHDWKPLLYRDVFVGHCLLKLIFIVVYESFC